MNVAAGERKTDHFKIKIVDFMVDTNDKSTINYTNVQVQKMVIMVAEITFF